MTATARPAVTDAMRAAFDRHLGDADEDGAVALVLGLLERGIAAEDIMLGLIARAQDEVGRRWARNEWSVAQEHAATHVSERALAALATATRRPAVLPGSVVVACPDGEWHTLPARIVAEVLRLRGLQVRFLGAHVPTAHLVSYLHQHGPDLVALSCMLPVRLPRVCRTIEACRLAGVPVLAGGSGFGPDGVWARALGADLYASGAADAADLVLGQWPPRLTGTVAGDRLCAEEHARLTDRRADLLCHLTGELRRRFPPMRDYTERQHEATLEDLAFLLDFFSAAVFVGDARLLTGYLDFTVGVLASRDVRPDTLDLVLGALAGPLHDLPCALRVLAAGRHRLAEQGLAYPD